MPKKKKTPAGVVKRKATEIDLTMSANANTPSQPKQKKKKQSKKQSQEDSDDECMLVDDPQVAKDLMVANDANNDDDDIQVVGKRGKNPMVKNKKKNDHPLPPLLL